MGLDMYLRRRTIGDFKEENGTDEVAYWRKANQIREWFVRNTGYDTNADCEEHLLTKEQLEQLMDDCNKVLNDHSLAKEIMPTSQGFFFGSAEYDEWYFEDLKDTLDQLTVIFETTDFETEEIYYYEWW
jgi:hypothetical protein